MTEIFCFGSNEAGRHGKGAALEARRYHGAINGIGEGLQGNSYAIPTKDANIKTLPLPFIKKYVGKFRDFAKSTPNLTYKVTPIGCGLAGYIPEDIAPMFTDMPENVILPLEFISILENMENEDRYDK